MELGAWRRNRLAGWVWYGMVWYGMVWYLYFVLLFLIVARLSAIIVRVSIDSLTRDQAAAMRQQIADLQHQLAVAQGEALKVWSHDHFLPFPSRHRNCRLIE